MISMFSNWIAERLWFGAIQRHRSRMGWRDAPRFTNYLDRAKRGTVVRTDANARDRADQFRMHGWSSFSDQSSQELAKSMLEKIKREEKDGLAVWSPDGRYLLGDVFLKFPEVESFFKGPAGDFLRAVYGAEFKIFYGVCYHSVHSSNGPQGSQLWHADGGPGTCINLMWCLSPVSKENGAMECLSWDDTVKIFEGERRNTREAISKAGVAMARREVLTEYYRTRIDQDFKSKINQPTGDDGLVFAFSNNIIHKGGFPDAGQERYVCVFHIYPSAVPTPFDRYRTQGIAKTASNPNDPAFGDPI